MNCNVTGECAYKEKSKNFHSFTDENGSRFGLGFHKSDSGLRQASQFRYFLFIFHFYLHLFPVFYLLCILYTLLTMQ